MTILIKKWNNSQTLNNKVLSELFPSPKYRVSSMSYETGTSFSGSAESSLVYVLSGCCEYVFDGSKAVISSNQYGDLPTGNFDFRVIGESSVELVNVWNLEEIKVKRGGSNAI